MWLSCLKDRCLIVYQLINTTKISTTKPTIEQLARKQTVISTRTSVPRRYYAASALLTF